MQAEVSVEILAQIVQSVFATMMGIEVSNCDVPWDHSGDRMTSLVYLTGDWNGAVMLECNPRQACQFAGLILCMEPPETADDDVRDVLGELANMIGGNMKSGMSTGVRLSMPSVMRFRSQGKARLSMRLWPLLGDCARHQGVRDSWRRLTVLFSPPNFGRDSECSSVALSEGMYAKCNSEELPGSAVVRAL